MSPFKNPPIKRIRISFRHDLIFKGFTLIELLVVISIIGLLASLAMVNFQQVKIRSRDTQRKADLTVYQSALQLFYATNFDYPCFTPTGASQDCDGTVEQWGTPDSLITGTSDSQNMMPSRFLKNPPLDPINPDCTVPTSGAYLYVHSADRKSYTIFAKLENASDPDAVKSKPQPAGTTVACNAGCATFTIPSGVCAGSVYNYWVNSP